MSLSRSPKQYTGVRPINPPNVILADRAPISTDTAYVKGDLWEDITGLTTYQYAGGGSWIVLGSGAVGGVVTLTGDSGGAISPVGGNIDLLGDSVDGVSVVGTAGTLTFNIAAASTTQRGSLEIATTAEAIAGTSSVVAVAPDGLQAKIGTQTAHGVAMGNTGATSAVSWSAAGTAGMVFTSGGAGADGAYVAFSTAGSTMTITSNATTQSFDVNVATAAQVQAGTSNTTFITPLRLAQLLTFGAATWTGSPILESALTTGAAPSGATGATNIMMLQNGEIWEEFIIGAGQTIIAPRMSSTGLLISLDLTATEGAEYNPGPRNNTKYSFTIGTSAAFYFECVLNAADVSGCEPLVIGFRKVEANNAVFADYTDYASIGLSATDGPNIWLLTELNAGGVTATDTTDTWTDGQSKTLRVLVSAAGVVTYTIGGLAPTVTAAFTFDATDVVIPFIRLTHGAAAPGAINWVSFKCGFQ